MKSLLKSAEIVCETDVRYQLYYWILSKSSDGKEIYGIEICKHMGDELKEVDCVDNISYSRPYVENIIDKLWRNTVTPIGLVSILDDII